MKFAHLALPAAVAAALLLPTAGHAQEEAQKPRIIVSGEGEATLVPDIAILTLSVMREAPTASAALEDNNKAMAAVVDALKAAAIAPRDLQTAGIAINPRYEYTQRADGTQEGKLVAYQVSNTLTVRVRDIAKTGVLIDQAVSLGVNNGGGISFTNEDPKPALDDARRKAVADAMAKAKLLAEAAGVTLGRVTEISDTVSNSPPVPIQAKAYLARSDAAPVEAGENSYTAQVNMVFELK